MKLRLGSLFFGLFLDCMNWVLPVFEILMWACCDRWLWVGKNLFCSVLFINYDQSRLNRVVGYLGCFFQSFEVGLCYNLRLRDLLEVCI